MNAGCATEGFPADADHASICAYFSTGISLSIKTAEDANAWAYDVIAALDEPPIEIIEIATAHDKYPVMDALKIGASKADWQQAGRWLLSDTCLRLAAGQISALTAIWISMDIRETTGLPRDLWIELLILEDKVNLISAGIVSAQQLQDEVTQVLQKYVAVAQCLR